MSDQWQHWREVVWAAMDDLGWDQGDLATHARISLRSVNEYLRPAGTIPRRVPTAVLRIERALGWDRGSTRAVLDGGRPITTGAPLRPVPLTPAQTLAQIRFLATQDIVAEQKLKLITALLEIPD